MRFLAERLEQGVPEREPMLEVLARRHYREHELHDLRTLDRRPAGRSSSRDYTLDDRPTHLVTTVGTHRRAGRPGGAAAWSTSVGRAGRRPRRRVTSRSSTSTCPGRTRRQSPDEASARLRRAARRACRSPSEVRRVAVAVCPGRRPAGLATSRSGPGRTGSSRTTWSAACTRWSAAGSTCGGCATSGSPGWTRPRTCCSTTASPRTTRPTSGSSRSPRCASSPSSATQDGEVISLPHAERAVANCLEAIRRARTSRGAHGAQLDMNHVWLHIWPVVDAQLDELTALQRTIAPLTAGAGIEEVLAQGRIAGPDGVPHPVAVRFSYQPGRASSPRSIDAADRAAPAARRLRPEGAAGPPPRHGLPLRARPGMLAGAGGTFVEHDLDDDRRAGARSTGRPGRNKAGHRRRRGHHADRPAPRGHHPGGAAAATRPRRWARSPSPSAPGSSRRSTSPSGCGCRWSGSRSRPAPGSRWTPAPRTWTGWRAALRADRQVHPGRRRDQRRRRRHQRRRPAVLERRGDDADAHQGHPGDDPGQRDGADRQAVAGLLRRRLGRGQLRHRRLRPGDGPQRAGAVLGARPGRRLRAC